MFSLPPAVRRVVAAAALAAFAAGGGAGCGTRIAAVEDPAPEEAAGPYPADYEAIARRWLESEVRLLAVVDEFSAEKPTPGFAKGAGFFGSGRTNGWRTVVRASGRDSIGMGTGLVVYALLLRDGRVVEHQKLLQ